MTSPGPTSLKHQWRTNGPSLGGGNNPTGAAGGGGGYEGAVWLRIGDRSKGHRLLASSTSTKKVSASFMSGTVMPVWSWPRIPGNP
jgi:hypothetical protein